MSRIVVIILLTSQLICSTLAAKELMIDYTQSSINFTVRHFIVFTAAGSFNDYQGSIYWTNNPQTSSFNGRINVKSIVTGLETYNTQLLSPAFFNEADYPSISFTSTMIESISTDNYQVTGELTCKGVTETLSETLHVSALQNDPNTLLFSTVFAINRFTYNIASHIGWPIVDPIVYVNLKFFATR